MPVLETVIENLKIDFQEIAASITRGDGRVVFDDEEDTTVARCEEEQTLERARNAFEQLQIMPDWGRKLLKVLCRLLSNNIFESFRLDIDAQAKRWLIAFA